MFGASHCRLPIRFDDAPAVAFDALRPTDDSRTRLYLQPVGEFLRSLRGSRRVIIEAPFYLTYYQTGSRDMTFVGPAAGVDQSLARLLNEATGQRPLARAGAERAAGAEFRR
jgi:hypothetical protein